MSRASTGSFLVLMSGKVPRGDSHPLQKSEEGWKRRVGSCDGILVIRMEGHRSVRPIDNNGSLIQRDISQINPIERSKRQKKKGFAFYFFLGFLYFCVSTTLNRTKTLNWGSSVTFSMNRLDWWISVTNCSK